MNKEEIKSLLMSIRNEQNAPVINNLLGKIDLISEEKLQETIGKIGATKDDFKRYVSKMMEKQETKVEHTKINSMYTYGINGDCAHLHVPVSLKKMLGKLGKRGMLDNIGLSMLDAIEKLNQMKKDGVSKMQNVKNLYMVSPIFFSPSFEQEGGGLSFLEELGFKTASYTIEQLSNDEFVASNPEAGLIRSKFGTSKNVGSAIISFDKINTPKWQELKRKKIEELRQRGATLDIDEYIQE